MQRLPRTQWMKALHKYGTEIEVDVSHLTPDEDTADSYLTKDMAGKPIKVLSVLVYGTKADQGLVRFDCSIKRNSAGMHTESIGHFLLFRTNLNSRVTDTLMDHLSLYLNKYLRDPSTPEGLTDKEI